LHPWGIVGEREQTKKRKERTVITLLTVLMCAGYMIIGIKLHARLLNLVVFMVLAGSVSIMIVNFASSISSAGKEARPRLKDRLKDIKFEYVTVVLTLVLLVALLAGKGLM
jgi:hypothetical protein